MSVINAEKKFERRKKRIEVDKDLDEFAEDTLSFLERIEYLPLPIQCLCVLGGFIYSSDRIEDLNNRFEELAKEDSPTEAGTK